MSTTRPFVLVHGGRHGPWVWDRVAPLLRATGAKVITPCLIGQGHRADQASPETGLAHHVRDLLDLFDEHEIDRAVLVGHSYGGAVAVAAMEILRERVERLILVDAHMPMTGQSIFDLVGPLRAAAMMEQAEASGDGWLIPVADASFWGVTDVGEASWINARLTPQPLRTYMEPVSETGYAHSGPYVFVQCSPSMISSSELEVHEARARKKPGKVQLVRVPWGHEAMISQPRQLAALIRDLA